MSVAEFGPQNLLRPLGKIRLSLKGSKEGQVSSGASMLLDAITNQLQGWPQLSFRELVHQVMEFIAHSAHASSVRMAEMTVRPRPVAIAVKNARTVIMVRAFGLVRLSEWSGAGSKPPPFAFQSVAQRIGGTMVT
jgi:hypothetical protein